MFVVAGVTGKTGGRVAEILLEQGKPVRALVRDPAQVDAWRKRGAEVVVAALHDQPALRRALKGATGLFALLPEDLAAGDFRAYRQQMADALASAVAAERVPLVVFLSTTAAFLADGNGPAAELHRAENALRATGARVVVVRACYLQENVVQVVPAARGDGIYPSFLPSADFPFPTVATRDVARLVARLLVEPPAASEVIDLLGPAYSVRQLAQALGRALGKDLRVVDVPAAAHVEALAGAGLPRPVAESIAEMFACAASGRVSPRGDRVEQGEIGIDETLALRLRA